MNKMSGAEAEDYIEGLKRRHRQAWEMTRVLGRLFVKLQTGKEWEPEFPWDDEESGERRAESGEDSESSEDRLRAVRERAKALEKVMNGQKGE